MSSVRIVVDNNTLGLSWFLEAFEYHPMPNLSDLEENYITVRLRSPDNETIGWVWASWSDHRTLCAHACCDPGALYAAAPDLFKLAEFLGAERIVVVPPEGRLKKLLPIFCRRLGFEAQEDGLYKELTNG